MTTPNHPPKIDRSTAPTALPAALPADPSTFAVACLSPTCPNTTATSSPQ